MLIGIAASGPRVGKTTTRNLITDRLPALVAVNFADALKDEVLTMVYYQTGVRYTRTELEALKSNIFGPLCQGLGALRRLEDPLYWVKRWDRRIVDARIREVITDDIRHLNEAQAIRDRGGYLLFVKGKPQVEDSRSLTHESEQHNAELELMADYRITNDGTVSELDAEIGLVLESIQLTERFAPDVKLRAS